MNDRSQRVLSVFRLQRLAFIPNFVSALLLSLGSGELMGFESKILTFIIAFILFVIIFILLGLFSLKIFQFIIYQGNLKLAKKELDEERKQTSAEVTNTESAKDKETLENRFTSPSGTKVSQQSINIVETPENFYGRYLDVSFYEWIVIADKNGVRFRYDFTGTADMTKKIAMEVDTILLPPGLLYKLQQAKA